MDERTITSAISPSHAPLRSQTEAPIVAVGAAAVASGNAVEVFQAEDRLPFTSTSTPAAVKLARRMAGRLSGHSWVALAEDQVAKVSAKANLVRHPLCISRARLGCPLPQDRAT